MGKHEYTIIFNQHVSVSRLYLSYSFGQTKDIQLMIGNMCAEIHFHMGVLKDPSQLISFKLKLFRDAYRKILLIYGIVMMR